MEPEGTDASLDSEDAISTGVADSSSQDEDMHIHDIYDEGLAQDAVGDRGRRQPRTGVADAEGDAETALRGGRGAAHQQDVSDPTGDANARSQLDRRHRHRSRSPPGSDSGDAAEGGGAGMTGSGHAAPHTTGGRSTGAVPLDVNAATAHPYLGIPDDLRGGFGYLLEGAECRLPILLLEGVVLFPGSQLPLKLLGSQSLALQAALRAPPPLSRLLLVLCLEHGAVLLGRNVGCTAEVRRAAQQLDASWHAVALGRQRAEVQFRARDVLELGRPVPCTILGDGCQQPVPRPIREHSAWWGPWATRPFDVTALAERVRAQVEQVLLPAGDFCGTPSALSFWVCQNLPLEPRCCRALLAAPDAAERLRRLLRLLQVLGSLVCVCCGEALSSTTDVLRTLQDGCGSAFVNAHGYVHDLITFKRVRGVRHDPGRPNAEFSWFPGYGWTVCYCRACGEHVGWRFTALQRQVPHTFWGLRRPALTASYGRQMRRAMRAAHGQVSDDSDDSDGDG